MMKKLILIQCLLIVYFGVVAQTKSGSKIPTDPQVKIGTLSNGLKYYIRHNEEPKNRAELRLVVKAGSILENEKQLGLAHFAEHMAFNGTKNFRKQELVDFLEKSGVNFGADLNAYTSFDETVYELQLPTDSANVFKKGFQILEDWAHNVSFNNEEIDKERGVVIEEWRLGRGADARLRDKYFPLLLKGSQYAKRIPIGTKENLESFKYETLKQFYKDWYRPDLQAVVVVGDFDVNEVEALVKKHFASIPKAANPKPRTKFLIPDNKETNIAILTDPEQQYNVLQVFYKLPAIPEAVTDVEYRSMLVRNMFNAMIGQRLEELIQKGTAPFVFANTNYGRLISNKDAFTLVAVTQEASQMDEALSALLRENERILQFGFTPGELERAKAAMLTGIENAYNEREKTNSAAFVGEYVRNFLDNEPIPGVAYEFELYKKYLPTVTLTEVNALISQWMKPTDRTVVIMSPESQKEKLPKESEVLASLNKKFTDLTAYEDKTVKEPLLAKLPPAGKVRNQTSNDKLGTTFLELSNGAKVILKPTTFKNDEILISAISKGGNSLYDDNDYPSAINSSIAVVYGGVGNFDMMSLQKELSGKNVYIAPSVSTFTEGLTGSSSPKDIETAMKLIHLYFTAPRKDSVVSKVVLQQLAASLANKDKDPNSVFMDTVSYVMGNYHPRRKPLTMATLQQIDFDKAYDIYKQRFANAGDFTFTFVGNFKTEDMIPLVEQSIGSLPSASGQNESWKDIGVRYPKGKVERVVRKGQENKASVRLYFTGTTSYSELEDVQMDQLAKVLSIRLREVLREDQGGVYGVGVGSNISRMPGNEYSVSISFSCAPENVEKLTGLVMEEVDKLKANGASQTNIDKVTAEDVRSLETQLKQNRYWQYNLEQKYLHGEDPLTILEDMGNVKKLTVERTKELANKYLSMENFAKMILLPEK